MNKIKILISPLVMMGMLLMLSSSYKKANETVTDIDGNVYHTVKIGKQVWMVENLKVTHYRNGDAIPNVMDNTDWGWTRTGAYCDYDNTAGNSTIYGHLYNWYTIADSRNISPAGWHVPTDAEWSTLTAYLGGNDIAGSKLREKGKAHWNSPNAGANNASGFTALPGGSRGIFGSFDDVGIHGYWWSATEDDAKDGTDYAWNRSMPYYRSDVSGGSNFKVSGFSVRCVKD